MAEKEGQFTLLHVRGGNPEVCTKKDHENLANWTITSGPGPLAVGTCKRKCGAQGEFANPSPDPNFRATRR